MRASRRDCSGLLIGVLVIGVSLATNAAAQPFVASKFEEQRLDMLRVLSRPIMNCLPLTGTGAQGLDRLSPMFHGCWDWHSAVHAAYSLYSIYRHTGDIQYLQAVEAEVRPDRFAAELNYMSTTLFNRSTEVSYGNAWFLALARERELATGATDMRPLAEYAVNRIKTLFATLTPATARSRVLNNNYNNLSWALIHLDLWAKHTGDEALRQYARDAADAWLFDPTLDAPGTQGCQATRDALAASNFFAPCLMRLGAVARIYGAEKADWIKERMSDSLYVETLNIPNPLDITHNNGVNFSRSFVLWWIYQATNQATVRTNAIRLLMDHIAQPVHWDLDAPYDVNHWVAQYAVRMIDASYEPNAPQTSAERPLQLALGDAWALGGAGPLPDPNGYVAQLHGALEDTFKTPVRMVDIGKATGTTNNPANLPNLRSNRLPYALDLIEHWELEHFHPTREPLLITLHAGFDVRFVRPSTPAAQVPALLASQVTSAMNAAADDWSAVRTDLDTVLRQLRATAPKTRIVIGTYDNPYRSCSLPVGGQETEALVAGYLEGGGEFAKGLNDVIREVAAAHQVAVAELYGALAAEDWAPDCDMPSASGHDKIAQAFAEAIKCRDGNVPGSRICSFRGLDDKGPLD